MEENLLNKVHRAVESLGKAPYDDAKTRAIIKKSTRKLIDQYEKNTAGQGKK